MAALLQRAAQGLLSRVDAWERAPAIVPTPREERSRFPAAAWDLRTLIAIFGPEAPFRFLNLNFVAGLTGLPFDRRDRLGEVEASDAFDLQCCLQGRGREASYKAYHSLGLEVHLAPDSVGVELPGRLSFSGTWPDYQIELRLPEEELRLDLALHSQPGFHWWARARGLYSHYTSFTAGELRWQWGGESGTLHGPVLHDHGWGRNLRLLQHGLQLFRYEVFRLPAEALLIVLICDGPAGFHLRRTALHRGADGKQRRLEVRSFEVETWERPFNYQGVQRNLPAHWHTVLADAETGATLELEVRRVTEAHPLLGDGFLLALDYLASGEALNLLGLPPSLEGEGYAEQMGRPTGPSPARLERSRS